MWSQENLCTFGHAGVFCKCVCEIWDTGGMCGDGWACGMYRSVCGDKGNGGGVRAGHV